MANKGGTADIRSLASDDSGAGDFCLSGESFSDKFHRRLFQDKLAGPRNYYGNLQFKRRTYHGKGKEISGIHHLHE